MKKNRFTVKFLFCAILFFSTSPARATLTLDFAYSLDSIGALRVSDNVDGIFAEVMTPMLSEIVNEQSRFVIKDLSRADAILLRSKTPLKELLSDKDILAQLAQQFRIQSVIRTHVLKEGPYFRIEMEWIKVPSNDVISRSSFKTQIDEDSPLTSRLFQKELKQEFIKLISKVPFLGQITGVDEGTYTVDIGYRSGLVRGDRLVVGTIDEVKIHPLLKEIQDWRITQTGKLIVENVEENIAFCKTADEESASKIKKYQKITQIIATREKVNEPGTNEKNDGEKKEPNAGILNSDEEGFFPRNGWLSAGLGIGSLSRQYGAPATDSGQTLSSSDAGKTGGALLTLGRIEGQLWLTREWFFEGFLSYGFFSVTQTNTTTGVQSTTPLDGNQSRMRFDIGYTYYFSSYIFGPKASMRGGLKTINYGLPIVSDERSYSSGWSSWFLGIGGDLPLRPGFGISTNIDLGIFRSYSDNVLNSSYVSGSSDIQFAIKPYYWWNDRVQASVSLEFMTNSVDFTINSKVSSLSYQSLIFVPTLAYYF